MKVRVELRSLAEGRLRATSAAIGFEDAMVLSLVG